MKRLLILLISIITFQNAYATHLIGSEITYTQLDSLRFKFDLVFYRNCSGVAFGNPTSETKLRCGSTLYNVSLTLVKIEKLITGNDSFCYPVNTYSTGKGVEKHYYTCTIDFGDSYYKAAYGCSNKLIFESGQCCRPGDITTGAANTNYYNFAELNLKASNFKNNSPKFLFDPVVFLCCNSPTSLIFRANDSTDFDSLSYHFSQAKTGYNSNVSYNSGYNFDNPYRAYYPGSYKFPYNNPNANPPIGIFLNDRNGDLIFTPTKCDEVPIIVIEVKEWRRNKDSSNQFVHIGTIRRDFMQVVRTCNSNNPVVVPQNTQYFVCADSTLCIDFTSKDHSSNDSIFLNVISDAPGANVTYSQSAKVDTAHFCYTAKKEHLAKMPFEVMVLARNNGSPYYGYAVKTVNIGTRQFTSTSSIKRTNCNQFNVKSDFDSSLTEPVIEWYVYNDKMTLITDTGIAFFMKQSSHYSVLPSDNVLFKVDGKYYIKQIFQPSKGACRSIVLDSIEVKNSKFEIILNTKDTLICSEENLLLYSTISYPSHYRYTWRKQSDSSWISTDSILNIKLFGYNQNETFTIRIEDMMGCSVSDQVMVTTRKEMRLKFQNEYFSCEGDTISIITGNNFHNFKWSNGVKGDTGKSWQSEKIVVFYSDSFNCGYTDTIQTVFNLKPKLNLDDFVSCDSVRIKIGSFKSVFWSDSTSANEFFTQNSGKYWVKMEDWFDCKAIDSFEVTIHKSPVVAMVRDTSICGDSIQFSLNPSWDLLWNTGAKTNSIRVNFTGLYTVKATDANGCADTSSVYITKLIPGNPPFLSIKGDSLISNQSGLHHWYRNDTFIKSGTEPFIIMNQTGNYHALRTDSNGCFTSRSNLVTYFTGSTPEIFIHQYKIYPNPNSGKFTISASYGALDDVEEIQLYDLHGRKIPLTSLTSADKINITYEPLNSVAILTLKLKSGKILHFKVWSE